MLSLSAADLYLELIALSVATLPLGLAIVRLGERLIGRSIRLSIPERLLLSLYATGGALYLVAALPIPIFGLGAVAVLLVGGLVIYAAIATRERAAGVRAGVAFVRTTRGLTLSLLTLAVLAVEVVGVANLKVGNTLDGSVYSLFVNLLLAHHTIPWTLSPFANVGVTYPQSAAVWVSLPVLLFGWPIITSPLALPPLFLALSVPSAYCLGERWTPDSTPWMRPWLGVLFAGFFGGVVSWPRLFVGGSFDFVFALPLFLVVLGWLVPLASARPRPWREIAVFGVVVGIAAGLSAMVGLTLLLLLVGYLVAYRTLGVRSLLPWTYRWLAVAGIAALALVRSLVAVAVWFNYPGHVLTAEGHPPP
ncbi:MAG: hypothetical protein ACREEC_03110, partial [Thermoplasmata archaeon]